MRMFNGRQRSSNSWQTAISQRFELTIAGIREMVHKLNDMDKVFQKGMTNPIITPGDGANKSCVVVNVLRGSKGPNSSFV